MAHDARHPRVRHHAGGQHGVRRGQHRAEQEALRPAQPDQLVRRERDDRGGDRHRDDELAERQPPLALEHLRLHLEAVAEQDHDQRDRGQDGDEARARVELEHLQAALAEHEAREDEERGEREEGAVGEARQQRAAHEHGAEDEQRDVEGRACGQRASSPGRVPDRVRLTVLGKSPSWQDADGACSGYLVEEAGVRLLLDCGSGVFAKLRAAVDYHAVDAVRDHPPARGPLPRPRPVRLRPDLRPAAARRRRVLHAPPGALECWRRVVGAWGNDDLIEAAFDVREYDPAETLHVGPAHDPLPARAALRARQRRRARRGRRRRPLHLRRRPRAVARAVRVRPRHRPAVARGHAARAGAGPAGPHHRRGGRRARGGRGRRAARASPTSATSSTSRPPAGTPSGRSADPSNWPGRGPSTPSEAQPRLPPPGRGAEPPIKGVLTPFRG